MTRCSITSTTMEMLSEFPQLMKPWLESSTLRISLMRNYHLISMTLSARSKQTRSHVDCSTSILSLRIGLKSLSLQSTIWWWTSQPDLPSLLKKRIQLFSRSDLSTISSLSSTRFTLRFLSFASRSKCSGSLLSVMKYSCHMFQYQLNTQMKSNSSISSDSKSKLMENVRPWRRHWGVTRHMHTSTSACTSVTPTLADYSSSFQPTSTFSSLRILLK